MSSKVLGIGLLAAGCVTAAAVGAYVAARQNVAPTASVSVPAPEATPAGRPVAETEAVVERAHEATSPPERRQESAPEHEGAAATPKATGQPGARTIPAVAAPSRTNSSSKPAAPSAAGPAYPTAFVSNAERLPARETAAAPAPPTVEAPMPDPVRAPELPPPPPEPEFEEVIVPAASVIGLQIDTPLSSERARVEDRVEARVTRDVLSAGRVAVPAGARVLGSVTVVERGGKVKERARIGVRFHTLVLANGSEVPLRTEAIFREGESPSGESARKIGGAAIGGAILGAIIGGGKGAVVGGATGAAGGTAAVMAGDRNAATLPAGTIVTVRLSAPLAMEVERQPSVR